MSNARLALQLIIPGFLLGVMFACLALGVVARGVFDVSDRAYFGFASFICFGFCSIGVLMLLIQKK
jgi:hypothetical protein